MDKITEGEKMSKLKRLKTGFQIAVFYQAKQGA